MRVGDYFSDYRQAEDFVMSNLKFDSILNLTDYNFRRLGLESKIGESDNDAQLRPTIISMRAGVDDPEILAWAKLKFSESDNINDIDPELKSVILSSTARQNDEADFYKMEQWYFSEKTSDEDKNTIAACISNFKSEQLVRHLLSLIIDGRIRQQDLPFWIAYMSSGRATARITWEWLMQNWPKIRELLATENFVSRIPVYASRTLWFPEFLDEFTKLWEENHEPCINLSTKQGIENITINGKWLEREIGV